MADARRLYQQNRKIPTAQQLIDFVGGCRKERALKALGKLRAEIDYKEVRSAISLPPGSEEEMRTFIGKLFHINTKQLLGRHVEKREEILGQMEELREEAAQARIIQGRLADHLERTEEELQSARNETEALRSEIAQLRLSLQSAEKAARDAKIRADERGRMLEMLDVQVTRTDGR